MGDIPILVVYHKNCHDGLLAAFTVWKFYKERLNTIDSNMEPAIEFIQVQPGTEAPNTSGKIVYILDVIFSKEALLKMIEDAISILIIDHHETSEEILSQIPDTCKIFDKTECAATLTWQNFYPEISPPLLYYYVKSRDLFLKDREFVNEFHMAFDIAIRDTSNEFNFQRVLPYLDDTSISGLINIGKVLNGYQQSLILKAIKNISFSVIKLTSGKLCIVGYINSTLLSNDIAAACLEEYPFIDFCACFYIDPSNSITQFQLRSTDEREDVSIIAREHGGGGHRNAAGMRLYNTECKLQYEHCNPTPLLCLYNNQELKLNGYIRSIFTEDYEKLLKIKFPEKTLKITLKL